MPIVRANVLKSGCRHAALLAIGAVSAITRAGEPIPVDAVASPYRDYLEARAAFERATSVDIYKQVGCRSAPWDADAIGFLEMAADTTGGVWGSASNERLEQVGRSLRSAECDDPMIMLALGRALREQRNNSGCEEPLRHAIALLEERGYPARRLGDAAFQLAAFLDAWNRHGEARQYHRLAIRSFLSAIESGEYAGHDRFVISDLDRVFDDLPSDEAESLCQQLETLEEASPWIKSTAWGLHHVQAGWNARGGGFGDTVTAEGWRRFKEHLEKAATHLVRAHELNPDAPEPATKMIDIAMAGYTTQDTRYWFDRAVAAAWDWDQAYISYQHGLRPRWGGSFERMYDFGLECIRTERYDTLVPSKFLSALIDMVQDGDQALAFWNEPSVYENARTTIEQLSALPENEWYGHWIRTHEVIFAWSVADWRTCEEALSLATRPLLRSLTDLCRTTERLIRRDVALYGSAVADAVATGDKAMFDGQTEDGIAIYRSVLGQIEDDDDDELLHSIVADRLATARFARDFDTGEWTDLVFERGLPGWETIHGAWQAGFKSNAVRGGPDADGMFLICRTPVGFRWELSGRIKTNTLKRRNETNAGIAFHAQHDYWYNRGRLFTIHSYSNEAVLRSGFYRSPAISQGLEGKRREEFTFHLQVWENMIVVYVDDQLVFADEAPIDPHGRYGPYFGLGGHYWFYNGFARYEDLRIRKLTEMPAELDEATARAAPGDADADLRAQPSSDGREH